MIAGVVLEAAVGFGTPAAVHAGFIALAGVAVISWSRASKTEDKTTEFEGSDRQIVVDNSLQQVETDLRDILSALASRYRIVFVLEELDKLPADGGDQLRDVIRYFKNLFTQAPALFFFLTDKQYFDDVDGKIAHARLEGSYAVEHTFFTQRIFVTRPSLQECLAFFRDVLRSDDARAAIDTIDATQGARIRRVGSMEPIEKFLRGLLFSSQNHLFDLKSEMRGYVRVDEDGGSRLEFDETALTAEEEGIAALHFLIEQKARLYRFDGGRDYANEVLRDSLSRAVADLGGSDAHDVTSLYPASFGPGSQVSRSERDRIVRAVDSLLAELERGNGIDRQRVTPNAPATFRWRDNAAANFAPVAELEPGERALVTQYERGVRIAGRFDASGRLARAFEAAITELNDAEQPLVAEEINRRSGDITKGLTEFIAAARREHVNAAPGARMDAGTRRQQRLLAWPADRSHRPRVWDRGGEPAPRRVVPGA